MKSFIVLLMVAVVVNAYSGGAPTEVCDTMVPQHNVDPQKSAIPYTVKVDKKSVKRGSTLEIVVSGADTKKDFKGYLLQVKNSDNKAVGSFSIPDTDKYSKTITCHNSANSAATHKNSASKKNLTLKWTAPRAKGTYTVYATVAENGGVFWANVPTQQIEVV